MEIIADLQVHSKHSRGTSRNISFGNLEKYGRMKGLHLLGTGDFQHPLQFKTITEELEEDENGILWSKTKFPFLWQTEISLIYTQDGKGQRIHHLIYAPNKEVAKQIIDALSKKGRLDYDGRPIFGFTSVELVDMMREISDEIEIIPAHVWTSHFSLMGEYNQLSRVEDCFRDNTKYIHALETGMSSNPADNWRLSVLDKFQLVSFSDAHCVHPDTLITLEDGYVLPISEIDDESIVAHADFKDMSYKNGIKTQYSIIPSPLVLKEVKCTGARLKVSDRHRFYTLDDGKIMEKFASQLEKGDLLLRLAKITHNDNGSMKLKKPDFDVYLFLKTEGLAFIKLCRNKLGLTQKQVAHSLGLYKDHYWKIEKGIVRISDRLLKKLVTVLDFQYNQFIENYVVSIDPKVNFPEASSIKLCELLGYFAGDGCLTKRNRGRVLYLTDKNKEILQYYKKIVKDLFLCDCRLLKCTSKNSYCLALPAPIARFFSLNFPELILKSRKRRIPRRLYCIPLGEVSAFLRGFFDAEGSFGHHNVDVCSSNKLLLYQIDSLLKKFGIFSTLSLYQLEKVKQKYRHRIYLYGENLRNFEKNINFNHQTKKLKLKKYIDQLSIKRKSKIKRFGDFIVTKVISVSDVKSDVDYLYDLAIPGYENYLADQLVVHNSHWPWRLGREATIFDFKELGYKNFLKAIRTGQGLKSTIETCTSYGKYHYTGHRFCGVSFSPEESKKLNKICPKCGRKLTIGVADRIEKLADRPVGYKRKNAVPFVSLVPLHELIAAVYDIKQLQSKGVWETYTKLVTEFKSEFNVLLNVSYEDLEKVIQDKLARVIINNREDKLRIEAGYDGVYGKIILDKEEKVVDQKSLSDFK